MSALENLMVVPANQSGEHLDAAWFRRGRVRCEEGRIRARAEEVIGFIGLAHVKNELAGNLSGGQKKLLELGRTMMADAKVVLLDEIGAGVNRTLLNKLLDNIERLNREHGYTFFVIEHDMDLIARLCDPVIVMTQGRVLMEGTLDEAKANPEVVAAYFGDASNGGGQGDDHGRCERAAGGEAGYREKPVQWASAPSGRPSGGQAGRRRKPVRGTPALPGRPSAGRLDEPGIAGGLSLYVKSFNTLNLRIHFLGLRRPVPQMRERGSGTRLRAADGAGDVRSVRPRMNVRKVSCATAGPPGGRRG